MDTLTFPLSVPKTIGEADIPIDIKDWNSETAVAMNFGDQVVFAANSAQLVRFYDDFKSYNFISKSNGITN